MWWLTSAFLPASSCCIIHCYLGWCSHCKPYTESCGRIPKSHSKAHVNLITSHRFLLCLCLQGRKECSCQTPSSCSRTCVQWSGDLSTYPSTWADVLLACHSQSSVPLLLWRASLDPHPAPPRLLWNATSRPQNSDHSPTHSGLCFFSASAWCSSLIRLHSSFSIHYIVLRLIITKFWTETI